MSGHSKWASIKHKKAITDKKRGAAFTKVTREITAAARASGGDVNTNPRLRTAIARARFLNMPNINVENAVKKGTGELPGIVYEGLTDNKNRTTAEVRNILSKKNGSLAGAGSTAWMFASKGFISIEKSKATEEQLMEIALESGADDIKAEGSYYEITCETANLEAVKAALAAKNVEIETAELTKVPNAYIKATGTDAKQMLGLMEALEEHEDIQAVHANFDISEEDMEKLAE